MGTIQGRSIQPEGEHKCLGLTVHFFFINFRVLYALKAIFSMWGFQLKSLLIVSIFSLFQFSIVKFIWENEWGFSV